MPGLKTIYTRDGTPIADVKASAVRSSLLNSYGEAVFFIATTSIKCRKEILNYGNYIVIQHDSLPDWVGILDTPRPWHHGYVEVHAFEVPYILQYRTTPLNAMLTGTPGELFSQLLAIANGQDDTLLREGVVFSGGMVTDRQVNNSVYVHIKEIREQNNLDWACTPIVDGAGRLTVVFDLLERAGVDTDLELSQGHNILHGDMPLEESGEIINSVDAVTDGQEDGVLNFIYRDEQSIKEIGLRIVRESFSGITDLPSLASVAKAFVDKRKISSIATPLTAVNVGQTFSNIRNGNVASYRYTDVGFTDDRVGISEKVRIQGWRYDETEDTCELFTDKVVV